MRLRGVFSWDADALKKESELQSASLAASLIGTENDDEAKKEKKKMNHEEEKQIWDCACVYVYVCLCVVS